MPNVAAIVDEMRKSFPNLKVLYAKDHETGHSVGKPSARPTNAWEIPEGFRPSRDVTAKKEKKS